MEVFLPGREEVKEGGRKGGQKGDRGREGRKEGRGERIIKIESVCMRERENKREKEWPTMILETDLTSQLRPNVI